VRLSDQQCCRNARVNLRPLCARTLDFGRWTLDYFPGGEALGGATLGFATGDLLAAGDGCGGGSSTGRVGEGKGGLTGFLVFEFSFALSFALGSARSFGLSVAAGDAEVFALTFAFTA
jgi:hypothetical protein